MISKKILTALCLTGAMIAAGASAALAADVDSSQYSYNVGKTSYKGVGGEQTFAYSAPVRNHENSATSAYESGVISSEQAAAIDEYLAENPDVRLDAEVLLEAGIADEAYLEAISEYAAQKHSEIHARLADEADGENPEYSYNAGKVKYAE